MAIKVTSGQINDGTKIYLKDDLLTGLPEEEEARLIKLGFAEAVTEENVSKEGPTVDPVDPVEQTPILTGIEDPEKVFNLNPDEYVAAGSKKTNRRK